jgi:Enoyl-(Acyl carrier protein) reductase
MGNRQYRFNQCSVAVSDGSGLLYSQGGPRKPHQSSFGGIRLTGGAHQYRGPGHVRTPFWTDPGGFADAVAAGSGATAQTTLDATVSRNMGISTGRVTEAEEVANLVAFLASSRAASIAGAVFVIDGGQIKTT